MNSPWIMVGVVVVIIVVIVFTTMKSQIGLNKRLDDVEVEANTIVTYTDFYRVLDKLVVLESEVTNYKQVDRIREMRNICSDKLIDARKIREQTKDV